MIFFTAAIISGVFYQRGMYLDNTITLLFGIILIRIVVSFRNWIQGCVWALTVGEKIFHDKIYSFIVNSSIPKPQNIFGMKFQFESGKYLVQKILVNDNVDCRARMEAMTVWFLYKMQEVSLSKTELNILSRAADRAVNKWADGC